MRSIIYILKHSDLMFSRLCLSFSSMLWAVMLFWPGDTFERPTYSMMGEILPEHSWAILFVIHSLTSIYSLDKNKINSITLFFEGILGSLIWTSSCFFMLLSVYPPPAAIAAEIVMAFTSWWILIRYPVWRER